MKEAVRLLQQLIKIDSQNPPGDERKIINFIKNYLKKEGVKSRIFEFRKKRPNLVCSIKSKNSLKKILFTPHVDTVPASKRGWQFSPFSGKIHKARVYGLGATDCKVNVAVSLALIKELKKKRVKLDNLDLVFAFTADEETGSYYGTIPLVKALKKIDYGVVLDANEFNIIVAQKGLLHLRVEVFGKEAHGAYPDRGINAIEKSINILSDIKKHKFKHKAHHLLKRPTLSVGRFSGGEKVNIVAGHAFFELDIRYLPFMKKDKIMADLERIIKKHKVKYRIKILAQQGPIEINKKNFLIEAMRKVLKNNKIKSKLTASFGATVINFLEQQKIQTFSFGFGTKAQAHAKNEYVKISNVYKGVKVLEEYVKSIDKYLAKVK